MLWTILWICWGGAFGVIEGAALINDKHDGSGSTLSAHFREWFRTDTKLGRNVWMVVSGLFFSWFIIHITSTGLVWP